MLDSADALPLPDAEARAAASGDLSANIMLEASAGTGKTTVLVQRMLNLLRAGVPLERIAAITFTEKAAGELQVKVRDAVEGALQAGADEAVVQRLRDAIRDLERANISTIHAFCARLLRERPVEAGVDPSFAVFDELTAFLLRHEVWDDWFREALDREDDTLAWVLDLDVESQALRAAAFRLLEHRDLVHLLPPPTDADIDAFRTGLAADVRWLRQQASACRDPGDGALRAIRLLEEQAAALRTAAAGACGRFLLLEAKPVAATRGRKPNWSPPEILGAVKERLQARKAAQERLQEQLGHNVVVRVFDWLRGYVDRYRREMHARGGIDFTDLLVRTRALLRDRLDVRGDLQRRFTHLLIDEFQDTDPLQAEIVFFLAEREPRAPEWDQIELAAGKLFVVGDPKQSIYRFRRADIEMYEAAKRVLAAQGRVLTLTTNFRSTRPVVDWVNAVFAALIYKPADGEYQPPYAPMAPRPEAASTGRVLRVEVGNQGDNRLLTLAHEARLVAALIERAVEAGWPLGGRHAGQPLRYRDFAVLFRANQPMATYESVFRDCGIPYRIAGGQRFYQREEIGALQALLRCLANPGDEVAVVATLRGPFFGFSDEDLFLFRSAGGVFNYTAPLRPDAPRADLFAPAFARLLTYHRRTLEVPPSTLLSEFFAESKLLPLLALEAQGDQRVANLLKAVDLARAVAAERAMTFRSFARFLDYMADLEAEESESPVAEESDDIVRLLTIHKAKGLEFPVVVLADGGQKIDVRVSPPIVDRQAGRLALTLGAKGSPLRDLRWSDLREREAARIAAEYRRLLYVAATRAGDYLVIPSWSDNMAGDFLGLLLEPSLGGSATRQRELPVDDHDRQVPPARGVIETYAETLDAGPRPPRAFRFGDRAGESGAIEALLSSTPDDSDALTAGTDWDAARATLLARARRGWAVRSVTEIKSEAQLELPLLGDGTGTQLGTAVHLILRRARSADDVPALSRSVGTMLNLGESGIERAQGLAQRAFSLPTGRLLAEAEQVEREVPFAWRDGDLLIEGQIDLACRTARGLVIADYKTDRVRLGRELEQRVLAYQPQAVTYARALECITGLTVVHVALVFLHPGIERRLTLDWAAEWARLRGGLAPAVRV